MGSSGEFDYNTIIQHVDRSRVEDFAVICCLRECYSYSSMDAVTGSRAKASELIGPLNKQLLEPGSSNLGRLRSLEMDGSSPQRLSAALVSGSQGLRNRYIAHLHTRKPECQDRVCSTVILIYPPFGRTSSVTTPSVDLIARRELLHLALTWSHLPVVGTCKYFSPLIFHLGA